jgi:hypothetical protein
VPADSARIAIARDLLTQLGVSLAYLHDAGIPASTVPTLADYLPSVIAAAGSDADRTYGSLWVPETAHAAVDLLLRSQPETGMIHRWRYN